MKKKLIVILVTLSLLVPVASGNKWDDVVRLKDQTLTYSTGHYLEGTPIPVGPDPYGYNYQGHAFDSYYPNAYLGKDGYPPYEGDLAAYDQRLQDEGYIPTTKNYGDLVISGGFQADHFDDVWDITKGDLVLSFTYDANGMVDDFGGSAHAWAELGVRTVGYPDFNPTWMTEGAGVWLATDYDWAANTFDPDPIGSPTLDIDDKLILQKGGGMGEGSYNLPSTPPNPWANHAVWFDRDGVDGYQAAMWGAIDEVTYNTEGTYDIVITLHATSATTGTAYMTINGEPQGFYVPGWHPGPADLMPAGMTFTGDMKKMQVFYGIYGYGATHVAEFTDITVDGYLEGETTGTPYGKWYWYPEVWLQMKWNDAWLANTDADDDGLLDRAYENGGDYIGSGAWLTNHQYPVEGDDWYYFVKIVAVPTEATLFDGNWYLDGELIGYEIWGSFAVIQEVDENGLAYKADLPNGWGVYQP